MRRRPARPAIILGLLALLCGALVAGAAAKSIFVEVGGLKTSFGATVRPRALPRSKRAAIGVVLSSRIQGDGLTHIPAIRQATIAIDRSVAIDTRGVPACTAGQLESQTSKGAEAACAAAVLGSGSARLEIAAPESAPFQAQSRLLAFNGGSVGGTTTILLHAYLTAPAPEAIVIPIEITKLPRGGFGLRAAVRVPSIAAGAGSLAAFDLRLRRRVATAGGGRHGYLLARCSDGNLVFEPSVEFDDGNAASGLLALGCTPKGARRTGSARARTRHAAA